MANANNTIYTDGSGRPIPQPEKPGPDAGIEEVIAYTRAYYVWRDKITDTANASFDSAFRKALCRARRST